VLLWSHNSRENVATVVNHLSVANYFQ
jgi:hypothetical protein